MRALLLAVLVFCMFSVTVLATPLANFTFWPAQPVVGQQVTFDGRVSLANPYPVLHYYWDFDTDGIVDAQGAVVSWTFYRVGIKPVRLVVVDWHGEGTEIVKIVPVVYQPAVQSRVVMVTSATINLDMGDLSSGEKIVVVGLFALAMLVSIVLVVRG